MRTLILLTLIAAACSNANTTPLPDFSLPTAESGAPKDAAVTTIDLEKAAVGDLVVNEAYPHGADDLTDPDWIELKNPTSATISLGGYTIADSKTTAMLPDEEVPAGQYVLILCDDAPDGGEADQIHVPFKLSGSGDEVHLKKAGNGVDKTSWGKSDVPDGKSWARLPDGTGAFAAATPTKLGPNMQ